MEDSDTWWCLTNYDSGSLVSYLSTPAISTSHILIQQILPMSSSQLECVLNDENVNSLSFKVFIEYITVIILSSGR